MGSLARWLRKALPHGGPSVCVHARDWQDLRPAVTPFLARKSKYDLGCVSDECLVTEGPRNHPSYQDQEIIEPIVRDDPSSWARYLADFNSIAPYRAAVPAAAVQAAGTLF